MATSLAQLIKRRRSELGLTQAQLAEKVGRTGTTVRRWERGESAPSTDVIEELAHALRVAPHELTEAPRSDGAAQPTARPVAESPPAVSTAAKPDPTPAPPAPQPGLRDTPAPPPKAQPQERPPIFPPRRVTPTERHRLVVPPEPDDVPTEAHVPAPSAQPADTQMAPVPVMTPRTAAVQAEAVAPPAPRRSLWPFRRKTTAASSYLDDQRQRWRYWLRYALTAIVLFIAFLVMVWAIGELVTALGDVWSLFGESEAPDPTSLGTDF